MSKIIGHTVSTPVAHSDWNENNERMSSFIKNKPDANVTRGYYFKAIDFEAKKLYLSHEQVKPVAITSANHATYYDADFQVPYAVGGKLGVVNNFEYSYGTSHFLDNKTWYPKATIVGIAGNVITYAGDIGFTSVYDLASLDPEDYSVYCIDYPLVGEHVLMVGGTNFGSNNLALCHYGFSAGKGNKTLGSYGVTLGRKCEAGYAAFATNFGNKAIAHRSFASGSGTVAEEFASHSEGEGTIARSVIAQHVQGKYNIPDNNGKYADIVGWGDSDSKRKNIRTLTTDGAGWYAKEVCVGGTSMDDAKRLATEEYVQDHVALIPLSIVEPNSTIAKITAKDSSGKPTYKDSFPATLFNRTPVIGDIFFAYGRTWLDKVAFHMRGEITGDVNGAGNSPFKALEVVEDPIDQSYSPESMHPQSGKAVHDALIATNIRAEGQTPGTTCPIAGANLGESRSNKLFAFPKGRIKLHAFVDDVWTEVNDPNLHKLFTNGMQAYTGSDGKTTTWRPFDNATNYLGAGKAVPTAWRITLTNPVIQSGDRGDRYVHLNAACIRVHGTPANSGIDLRVVGRQQKGTEVTYISSFALAGSPSYNTCYFDEGAAAAFGGWTPSATSTNLNTLYIYFARDTSKQLNKNFAVDEIHFFGRQTYVSDLNMVSHDHAYKVSENGKDVAFQGKIEAQPATEDNQLATLGQMKTAASDAVAEVVGSSKETLDTLEELGKALGEDPNFATTVTNKLSGLQTKVDKVINGSTTVFNAYHAQCDYEDNVIHETYATKAEHAELKAYHDELKGTLDSLIDENDSANYNMPVVCLANSSIFSDVASRARELDTQKNDTVVLTIPSGLTYAEADKDVIKPDSIYLVYAYGGFTFLLTPKETSTAFVPSPVFAPNDGPGLLRLGIEKDGSSSAKYILRLQKANANFAFNSWSEDYDRKVYLVRLGSHPFTIY